MDVVGSAAVSDAETAVVTGSTRRIADQEWARGRVERNPKTYAEDNHMLNDVPLKVKRSPVNLKH
jgi:hypothetical protein